MFDFLATLLIFLIWTVVSIFSLIAIFAGRYSLSGLIFMEPQQHAITHETLDAYYFSVTTWTTLGLGDFVPSPNYRVWVALEAMVGYYIMALFILVFIAPFKRDESASKSAREEATVVGLARKAFPLALTAPSALRRP